MSSFLFPDVPYYPSVDPAVLSAFRVVYATLLVLTLAYTAPSARRFFVSDRWRGYGQSRWSVDWIQNPVLMPVMYAVWLGSGLLLILGRWVVPAALVNLLLCRYFFIQMRWNGTLRGMGAPGFLAYWMAAAVFALELTARHDPRHAGLAILVFQIDFAAIMLSAGVYKFSAGYRQNNGMELGMINPMWGYWGAAYRGLRPSHWVFKTLNQLAWATEVVAGALMLLPRTRLVGALLIAGSFLFIAVHIRLAFLCEMVIAATALFFAPATFPGQWIAAAWPAAAPAVTLAPDGLSTLIGAGLWAYLVLLPLAHAGLCLNFYGRRRLPAPVQRALEIYTNLFGIIIWRVFSADHTNFYVDVFEDVGGARRLVSTYRRLGRFWHVGECIAVTTVFTTLKYYPGDSSVFAERLARYARTLPDAPGALLVFVYTSVTKDGDRFDTRPVAEYVVDRARNTMVETRLDAQRSVHDVIDGSPIHPGARPGSYAPPAS